MPVLAGDVRTLGVGRAFLMVTDTLDPATSPDGFFFIRLPLWVVAVRCGPVSATPVATYIWGNTLPIGVGSPPVQLGVTFSQAQRQYWMVRPVGVEPVITFTSNVATPHKIEMYPWVPGDVGPVTPRAEWGKPPNEEPCR